ncbi:MAG: bifunctional molybdenum cofactor biosynthesis protein MoaC/MoaB [Bacteroidetes bacterium]|nr:bifunctional molybdenum cofactor biosynthesis protein MoaC/MoaB [Bacteroidota bacterium]
MINITHKSHTLRQAVAKAILCVSSIDTIRAIQDRKVPKGDIFEFGRAAGLLGIKKTADIIPDCHPLPIEYAHVNYEIIGLEIHIYVEVHTIYKTGVEVEAMHGASVVALTIYDMLKPIDKGVLISTIYLVSKKGGKSDFQRSNRQITASVVVCSDSISQGLAKDKAGKWLVTQLLDLGIVTDYPICIPDDAKAITDIAKKLSGTDLARPLGTDPEKIGDQNGPKDLVIFVGGTGLSSRDLTPESIRPLLTREIDGIMEIARNYGQQRMPYAMLSRGIAGCIDRTLVITFPGSSKGVKESFDALFPSVLHVFDIMDGQGHGL